jgi:hypothetical protein
MRYIILLLLATIGLSADEFHIFGYEGPRTVYRGKTAWFAIRGSWMNWRTVSSVTVGEPGGLTTSSAHGIAESTQIYFKSTGTVPSPLPSGLVPMFASNVTSTTLEVKEIASVAYDALEFLDAGSGTISVGTAGNYSGPTMTYSISGEPAGTTYEIWRVGGAGLPWTSLGTASSGNLAPALTGQSVAFLSLTVSDTATLGAATITFNVTQAAMGTVPVSIPITVAAMPTFNVARPASTTTVPMLAEFAQSLKAIGTRNCVKATGAIIDPNTFAAVNLVFDSSTGENQIGYYDGGWGFDQMAEYLGDDEWRNCGNTVLSAYRDWIMSDDSMLGNRVFPDGLFRRMQETRDGRYRHALHRLVNGVGAYAETGGQPGNVTMRETAYALSAAVSEAQIRGEPLNEPGQRAAEFLLADFEQHFDYDVAPQSAIFQDALTTQALIKYWELTGDTRIPVYVKKALDWWWANAWEPVTGQFYYTAHEYGGFPTGCWKKCKPVIEAEDEYVTTALVLPAYGWYYSVTGDTDYLDIGDDIFDSLPFMAIPDSFDHATDTFTLTDHGLVEGQSYKFATASSATGTVGGQWLGYTGMLYICNATDDTFQVSAGAACSSILPVAETSAARNWVITRQGVSVVGKGKDSSLNIRWVMKYLRWRQLRD